MSGDGQICPGNGVAYGNGTTSRNSLGGIPHVVEDPQKRLGQDLKSLLADFETYRRGIRYLCG